jgi:hypothetical protein
VLVKVYFGYVDGVAKPSVWSGPPLYGELISQHVRSVHRLELWPLDFPMNTTASTTTQPLCLWKPEVSAVVDTAVVFSGVEKVRRRRVAQRWLCEPRTRADITRETNAEELCRPREVEPYRP